MIQSRVKNQEVVKRCITKYYNEHDSIIGKVDLLEYTKFLVEYLLSRVEDEDCYFVNMLEDISRIGEA